MKYKLSPLNLVALVLFSYGVYFEIEISGHAGAGLAGLIPYIFMGAAVFAFIIDFILQLLLSDYKAWLYGSELLLILFCTFLFLKDEGMQTLVINERKPQYIRIIYGVNGQPKLRSKFYELKYDTEVPWYGTILTSTTIEDNNDDVSFKFDDENNIVTNWSLIPIEANGKFYCKERNKFIRYRLWYLSNTDTLEKETNWVDSANVDFETAKQLSIQCQY